MKFLLLIITLCCIANAQKRFTSEHFVQKYNLKLPKVTADMLDASELTHTSDSWRYIYQGKTENLDSVVQHLTIEGFKPNRTIERYKYENDTAYVRYFSVSMITGDTLNNSEKTFTENFKNKSVLDLKTNCIWKSQFDERGIKLLDVRKCPGEKEFGGQVFSNVTKKEYIESIETYRGEIDSNSIRRYYLTPFDSVVADFMVKKNKEPFIVRLNTYGKNKKKESSFSFGIYSNNNEVLNFDYYTYASKDQLKRVYHFEVKDRNAKDKEYELVNFTEYDYDDLGRKRRTTTKVRPDKKEQEIKEKKK